MNKFELVGNPSLMGSGGNGAEKNDDTDLIDGVTADYSLGRHRGLNDHEIEAKVEEIMAYLINRNTPKKAVGEKGYPRCPVCNESLIGEYCYKCGQRTY